jgi:cytochrome b561
MQQQPIARYDFFSRLLHWLTAIAATTAFVLGPENFGRLIHDGVDPASRSGIVWHESLGILVFALTLLRLLWVVVRPAVRQIPMARWMQLMGKFTHMALWALTLALPMSALMALGSEGNPLTLLGGLRIDHFPFIAQSWWAPLLDWGDVHKWLGDALMWLAGLHAAAGIYHGLVLKDGVLASMLPYKGMR